MLGQLFAIIRNTFLEGIRQPVFLVLVLAAGLLQIFNVALSAYSMGYTEQTEVSGDDKFLLEVGLATVLGVATLLAAFLATSILSREIENKTVLTVVSKPVSRPIFVIGKYIGVAAAIFIATVIMLVWFQLAVRHSVMSTARDDYDMPVLLFGFAAVALSVGIGAWCNYFYNMVFTSTAVLTLMPLSLIAWLMVMLVSPDWEFQSFAVDFKPQITIACGCLIFAMLVLSAFALACSTRLGQVLTITVCAGVFMLGLLSNYLLGRHAYINEPVGQILETEFPRANPGETFTLEEPGDTAVLRLANEPKDNLSPGTPIYYGPSPNGLALAVPNQPSRFPGDPADADDTFRWDGSPMLVVQSYDPATRRVTIVNAGGLDLRRPPTDGRDDKELSVDEEQALIDEENFMSNEAAKPTTRIIEIQPEGDFVFTTPTEVNVAAASAWSVIPNLQVFWLTDAITQGHSITGRYVLLLAGYSTAQILALLAISVMLFQSRDMA